MEAKGRVRDVGCWTAHAAVHRCGKSSARCASRNPAWWAVWAPCCDRERTATDRYPVLLSRTGGARSRHSTSIIARLLDSHRGMTNVGRNFPNTSYIQKTLAGLTRAEQAQHIECGKRMTTTHAEIVQAAGNLHHEIRDAFG